MYLCSKTEQNFPIRLAPRITQIGKNQHQKLDLFFGLIIVVLSPNSDHVAVVLVQAGIVYFDYCGHACPYFYFGLDGGGNDGFEGLA